jgi:mannose/fructose/N-acetylgalactosamine-specific phosphotransferase system component IIC
VDEATLFTLFLVIVGIVLGFGYAFRSGGATRLAILHIRGQRVMFRRGFVPLLVGIAITSEASALRWLSDLPPDNPLYLQLQTAGLVLIIVGLAMLTLVVLSKSRPG